MERRDRGPEALPRLRLARRPGFVGWVIVLSVWSLLFAAALAYGLSISKTDALWALPAMFLVMYALPLYLGCGVLWVALTRRERNAFGTGLARALPWVALLSPLSCLTPG